MKGQVGQQAVYVTAPLCEIRYALEYIVELTEGQGEGSRRFDTTNTFDGILDRLPDALAAVRALYKDRFRNISGVMVDSAFIAQTGSQAATSMPGGS